MRALLFAFALVVATVPAVQAAEWTWSSQTMELSTMLGSPPPSDATRLDDARGATWLSHQNGVLVLTAEATGFSKYVTFELGAFDAWRLAAPDKKGRVVVEAFVGADMKTLTFDLSKVHSKRALKVTIKSRTAM